MISPIALHNHDSAWELISHSIPAPSTTTFSEQIFFPHGWTQRNNQIGDFSSKLGLLFVNSKSADAVQTLLSTTQARVAQVCHKEGEKGRFCSYSPGSFCVRGHSGACCCFSAPALFAPLLAHPPSYSPEFKIFVDMPPSWECALIWPLAAAAWLLPLGGEWVTVGGGGERHDESRSWACRWTPRLTQAGGW